MSLLLLITMYTNPDSAYRSYVLSGVIICALVRISALFLREKCLPSATMSFNTALLALRKVESHTMTMPTVPDPIITLLATVGKEREYRKMAVGTSTH